MGSSELVTFITMGSFYLFFVECMIKSVTILVVGFFFFLIYITVRDVQSWLKLNVGFVSFYSLISNTCLSIRSRIKMCTVLYSEQSFELSG